MPEAEYGTAAALEQEIAYLREREASPTFLAPMLAELERRRAAERRPDNLFGTAVGRISGASFGGQGVLPHPAHSPNLQNIVLRPALLRGDRWEQVAHVVLTPDEARGLANLLNGLADSADIRTEDLGGD